MERDYSRQSFLGAASSGVLRNCKIAVVGLCGGGSHVVQQLAHIGVGEFVLCDLDRVDASNLNRMVGAQARDAVIAAYKADVLERELLAVNPAAKVSKALRH